MNSTNKLRIAGLAIILAWGWKRAAIALVAGALSALAMAPFNAWPVLFLTFPIAIWLIDGAGAGRWRGVPAAAMSGFWFGLGYFVVGLYWIGLRLPGRCTDLRLADAVRGAGPAGLSRAVHRGRLCAGAPACGPAMRRGCWRSRSA